VFFLLAAAGFVLGEISFFWFFFPGLVLSTLTASSSAAFAACGDHVPLAMKPLRYATRLFGGWRSSMLPQVPQLCRCITLEPRENFTLDMQTKADSYDRKGVSGGLLKHAKQRSIVFPCAL